MALSQEFIEQRRRRRSVADNVNENHFEEPDEFGELFDQLDDKPTKPRRGFNPSVDLNPVVYCRIVNSMPWVCYEKNILELWKNDNETLQHLDLDGVIR